ncbi:hypothetical protein D9M71_429200 [compost metagenome]
MVVADQLGHFAFVADAQARTAVAADVMEGVHLAFGTTHHQDRVLADLQGDVVAFRRNLAGHAGDQPFFLEDLLHVDLEQTLVGVERLGQRVGALAGLQHLGGGLACRFQWIAQAQGCGDVHRVFLGAVCGRQKVANRCCGAARLLVRKQHVVLPWSVRPKTPRTVSMGDMADLNNDAPALVSRGWSR